MKHFYSKSNFLIFIGLFFMTFNGFCQDDEGDDFEETETFTKIRLGFHSHNNFYRQLLLGFQEDNATEGIDPGYDAINLFNLPNDMYFLCGGTELFIQGVGYWDDNNIYPIGVRSNADGSILIKIDTTENLDPNQSLYIYDADTQQYFDLKGGDFVTTVGTGTFNERFSLRFVNQAVLGVTNPTLNNGLTINYISSENILSIKNTLDNTVASDVTLYNINGQKVSGWNIKNQDQANLTIPFSGFSRGVYIVNVKTSQGTITKKIVIK